MDRKFDVSQGKRATSDILRVSESMINQLSLIYKNELLGPTGTHGFEIQAEVD